MYPESHGFVSQGPRNANTQYIAKPVYDLDLPHSRFKLLQLLISK